MKPSSPFKMATVMGIQIAFHVLVAIISVQLQPATRLVANVIATKTFMDINVAPALMGFMIFQIVMDLLVSDTKSIALSRRS